MSKTVDCNVCNAMNLVKYCYSVALYPVCLASRTDLIAVYSEHVFKRYICGKRGMTKS